MSFERENFSPAFISGTKTIRLFVYAHDKDTLKDMMAPGYFNSQRILLQRNSLIKVIAKDCIAELVVGAPNGVNVVIRPEYFLAKVSEEFAESELTPAQKRMANARASKQKKDELKKTG